MNIQLPIRTNAGMGPIPEYKAVVLNSIIGTNKMPQHLCSIGKTYFIEGNFDAPSDDRFNPRLDNIPMDLQQC